MKIVVSLLVAFLIFSLVSLVSANNILTIETNIFAEEENNNEISIEVPDYLFIGNLTEMGSSEKFQIYVNNTGNTDIIIKPQLVNLNDEIFSNIYFQNRKTGNNSQIKKIGAYEFGIAKPSSQKRSEYFWLWLDLSNTDKNLVESDLIGKKADIRFVAIADN